MKKAYTAYFNAAHGGAFPNPDLSHEMHSGEHEKFLSKMGSS
jgi:3-methyl-2-oxobutanoate hydroxymethyltransferase